MRILLLLLFWVLANPSIAQDINESKEKKPRIELLLSKKVSKVFNARAHTLIHDKNAKRVMVRCKLFPVDNKFDINSFSLIDPINKIRYRLSDISAYYTFGGPGVPRFYREQPFDKKGDTLISFYAKYDPDVEDTFLNYDFKDFQVSETTFPFPSGQRISTYFGIVESKRKFTADLYFVVHKFFLKQKDKIYSLYFGNEKVVDVTF